MQNLIFSIISNVISGVISGVIKSYVCKWFDKIRCRHME